MSEQTVETLSPEILAQAQKLLEKRQKAGKEAATNAEKYPGVVPGTLRFDPVAEKNLVTVKCVECGEDHSRYTSDLFQTHGLCPTCRKAQAKDLKTAKKELLKKAMEAIRKGQIV